MMTLRMYNIFALLIIAFLLYVIFRVHNSQVNRRTKLLTQTIAGILLIAVILMILFLDAIAVGIIGLVPS
ncbi:MAG: hypothetical protein KHY76_03635 [Butyricicoccus pullicaecorum]|nr:hypothetical protein [Butyricicoccus pullicaecorum]